MHRGELKGTRGVPEQGTSHASATQFASVPQMCTIGAGENVITTLSRMHSPHNALSHLLQRYFYTGSLRYISAAEDIFTPLCLKITKGDKITGDNEVAQ